ncbi:ThuA domain-containing protein [Maribacter sp. ACAM166]|uniref:ThuA domain-containing protein n=1 Tax=Maribacter sp. ACAM166 TaxID=2508996 RepID=UPI0010FEB5B2|nr:ThuA domain-containing protein [Maribacter sp. ACAM166]TLP74015.1 ThuA domain-containing protein [Maribacter sp. ACAM166]
MKKSLLALSVLTVVFGCNVQKLPNNDNTDSALGHFISNKKNATRIAIMVGGGASHDFLNLFGIIDGAILYGNGRNTVIYTEDLEELSALIPVVDVLMLSNNKPLDDNLKNVIFEEVNFGKLNLLINHPSNWYNWKDWPQYNQQLVGGGSESHEKLQEFEVTVVKPDHPLMNGVPPFRIVDELYRWKKDAMANVEVLAVGRGLESGEEFPVIWTVKHPKVKIVGSTLGHDERAHDLETYRTILKNS